MPMWITPLPKYLWISLYTNTRKIIVETVNTADGQVCYDGDYAIAGVPGTAALIKLSFLDSSGTLGKGILPTGNVVDELEIPDFGRLSFSIVDAANPLVFVTADSIKMNGTEPPEEINKDEALLRLLECIRGDVYGSCRRNSRDPCP